MTQTPSILDWYRLIYDATVLTPPAATSGNAWEAFVGQLPISSQM